MYLGFCTALLDSNSRHLSGPNFLKQIPPIYSIISRGTFWVHLLSNEGGLHCSIEILPIQLSCYLEAEGDNAED